MHHEPDETVAVYRPGKESGITLRFSLHPKGLHRTMPADISEQFVADYAKQRGLTVTRLRDRVFADGEQRVRLARPEGFNALLAGWRWSDFCRLFGDGLGSRPEIDTVQRALAFVPQIIERLRLT
jgi:hypothetical protein